MSNIHGLREPLMVRFRSKRIRLLYECFDIREDTKVLDVGGELFFWQLAENLGLPLPKVTILNLHGPRTPLPRYVTWVVGDANRLAFDDAEFDLIFCNSVIEHLGGWDSQMRVASEIRRVGKCYFVQTPLKGFPIEPHYVAPFIHWLPKCAQRKLARHFTLWGLISRPTPQQCESLVEEIRLLSRSEMRQLFPKANILVERLLGWPKSVVALG